MDMLSSYSISFTNINLHFHMVNKRESTVLFHQNVSICAILHYV